MIKDEFRMKDENHEAIGLFEFNDSEQFKECLLDEIDNLDNLGNNYKSRSHVLKQDDDGFDDYEIPMDDECEMSDHGYNNDIKEEYNNDFDHILRHDNFVNEIDMKYPTTSTPIDNNFNLTSKTTLQLVSKGSSMYQKYDILTRIEKRFGKGHQHILKTNTDANNYLDPSSWAIDKKKMLKIAGIKNMRKHAIVKNDKNSRISNKLDFDWDLIKEMKPSDFFKAKTTKGQKSLHIKETFEMDILLCKNKNMKGIDFNIKADRFLKLFARQIDPPKFFEYNEEENNEGKKFKLKKFRWVHWGRFCR